MKKFVFKKSFERDWTEGPETNIVTKPMEAAVPIVLPWNLSCSAATDIGTREYQQDSMSAEAVGEYATAIICDGMGGLAMGDKASKVAIDAFRAYVASNADAPITEVLSESAYVMNRAVLTGAPGGGSTIACALIKGRKLYYLSIGDSKLYIIRNGVMECVVKEHNYKTLLNESLMAGTITQAVYEQQISRGDALIGYLGMQTLEYMDVSRSPIELLAGDTIVLCSDGLYKSLPEDKILKIINGYAGSFSTLASYLIDRAAAETNSRDNTSVIIIKCN